MLTNQDLEVALRIINNPKCHLSENVQLEIVKLIEEHEVETHTNLKEFYDVTTATRIQSRNRANL